MKRLLYLSAALMLLVATACGGGDDAADPAADEGDDAAATEEAEDTAIEVAMTEFAFAAPESVPATEFEVTAVNNGEQPHEMGVIPLKEGAPPVEELARMSDKELQKWLAGEFGGTEGPIKPGEEKTFTLDGSEPASFAFACLVRDPKTKKPHVQLGMFGSFEVES